MFQVMGDDMTLYKWLTTLEEDGVCLLTDAPCEKGQLKKIGTRVSFLRNNSYGYTASPTQHFLSI